MNKKAKRLINLILTISLLSSSVAFADEVKPSFSEFPESYRPYLTALKEKYPNWNFVPDKLNLDFNEAVDNEAKNSLSLVENTSPASWKSVKEEDFDFEKNTWKVYDGDNWVAASREIVAYYMDPRNFLPVSDTAETKSNFQFLDFSYDSEKQTKAGLQQMIKGTFLEKDVIVAETGEADILSAAYYATSSDAAKKATPTDAEPHFADDEEKDEEMLLDRLFKAAYKADAFEQKYVPVNEAEDDETEDDELIFLYSSGETYADIIMEAAEVSGISPYVLAAFILQEQGTEGTSDLISGSQKDYPGFYNYFNVGAYATNGFTSIQRGLWWAKGQDNNSTSYGRPWDTPKKAIINGAAYLSEGYLKKGQNTIYYKRFNVGPERKTTLYLHQYMTNVQGAWAEGWLLGKSCEDNGILKDEYTFHIPVYDNMPGKAVEKPTGDLNPNYKLKSLEVKGYDLTPAFNMSTYDYTVTAGPSVAGVTVNAESIAKTSAVAGIGNIKLTGNETKIKVTVTAENKTEKVYTITVKGGTGNAGSGNGKSSGGSSGGSGKSSGGGSSGGSKSSGGSSGGGGGGGGGTGSTAKKAEVKSTGAAFSKNWYSDSNGVWRIKNSRGEVVRSAWLCDDAVSSNGRNVWYLMNEDGTMLAAGLVQDNTGHFYSLETTHNGYYGMLRYTDGTYDCNGIKVYIEFSRSHDGSFGAIKNREAIEKLTDIYGVTAYGIGNESCVYTETF